MQFTSADELNIAIMQSAANAVFLWGLLWNKLVDVKVPRSAAVL